MNSVNEIRPFQFCFFAPALVFCCLVLSSSIVIASSPVKESYFANEYEFEKLRVRSGWSPVLTFFLPGLDQFWEKQYAAGATYSIYGISGLSIANYAKDGTDAGQNELDSRDNGIRQQILGMQMYQTAGSLSAYQAFRSNVNLLKGLNAGYDFLKVDETTAELAAAPFEFSFLKRPTTYIPLAVVLGVVVYGIGDADNPDRYIDDTDMGYTAGFSYQAGLGEEAVFRGWLMPSFRQAWGSDFWSNGLQATLFSVAHISSENPYPLWQFGLGYYLGWLTQRNKWSLRESIFIHAWWDVIAFTGIYLAESKRDRRSLYMPLVNFGF